MGNIKQELAARFSDNLVDYTGMRHGDQIIRPEGEDGHVFNNN